MTQNLKTENAELRARVGALEAKLNPPVPVSKRIEEEGTRIYRPEPSRHFTMPSDADLRRLLEIVLRHSPTSPPPEGEERFFRQFKQVFAALGEIGRATEIDQQHGIVHWLDKARDICREHGWSQDFEFRPFWCAMLAHGDIHFQDRDETLGLVQKLGLADYGGILAGDAWRVVLERDTPRPPTMTFRQKFPIQRTTIHVQEEA